MPNPILDAARQRLTAIAAERSALDREERELRAMVAAAEGASVQPAPMPTVAPFPVTVPGVWPPFVPAPSPFTPWIVRGDHGGMCACPACVPRITCGEGWTSTGATLVPRYACQGGPSCGCGCNGFLWCGSSAPLYTSSELRLTADNALTVGAQTISLLGNTDHATISGSCGAASTFTGSLLTSQN